MSSRSSTPTTFAGLWRWHLAVAISTVCVGFLLLSFDPQATTHVRFIRLASLAVGGGMLVWLRHTDRVRLVGHVFIVSLALVSLIMSLGTLPAEWPASAAVIPALVIVSFMVAGTPAAAALAATATVVMAMGAFFTPGTRGEHITHQFVDWLFAVWLVPIPFRGTAMLMAEGALEVSSVARSAELAEKRLSGIRRTHLAEVRAALDAVRAAAPSGIARLAAALDATSAALRATLRGPPENFQERLAETRANAVRDIMALPALGLAISAGISQIAGAAYYVTLPKAIAAAAFAAGFVVVTTYRHAARRIGQFIWIPATIIPGALLWHWLQRASDVPPVLSPFLAATLWIALSVGFRQAVAAQFFVLGLILVALNVRTGPLPWFGPVRIALVYVGAAVVVGRWPEALLRTVTDQRALASAALEPKVARVLTELQRMQEALTGPNATTDARELGIGATIWLNRLTALENEVTSTRPRPRPA